MADWEDSVLNCRHLHNRAAGSGREKGGRTSGTFDVHKTFGIYEVDCPSARKLSSGTIANGEAGRLDIYTLDDRGKALYAELLLPSVLHANVLMTGSRATMTTTIQELEKYDSSDNGAGLSVEGEPSKPPIENNSETDDSPLSDSEATAQDNKTRQRIASFEKNSFRQPKFWVQWQGNLLQRSDETLATDFGYLVFSGNGCEKFKGTLTCQALGWDNVKITGRKTASRSARDCIFRWVKSDTTLSDTRSD